MTSYTPREAMTTAESPEPLIFQHSEFFLFNQILQQFDGPGGEAFCLFCVICGFKFSCPFVPFVVPTLPYSTDADQSN